MKQKHYGIGCYTPEWGAALKRALAANGGRQASAYIREAVAMRLKAEGFWEDRATAEAADVSAGSGDR